MRCVYINLDASTDRRAAIEADFKRHGRRGWTLERFAAVDVTHVARRSIPGAISPAEKACFLSHVRAVDAHAGDEAPVFILEDDVRFGRFTCRAVDAAVRGMDPESWDVLYTAIGASTLELMIALYRAKRAWTQGVSAFKRFSLRDVEFHGSYAYVINGRAKRKLVDLLRHGPLNLPHDLRMRALIGEGAFRGFVLLPFVTGLSALAAQSTIQPDGRESPTGIWDLFGRLVWADGGAALMRDELEGVAEGMDEDARAMGLLISAMVAARRDRAEATD